MTVKYFEWFDLKVEKKSALNYLKKSNYSAICGTAKTVQGQTLNFEKKC